MEHIETELKIITTDSIRKRLKSEFEDLVSNELLYPESVTIKLTEEKIPNRSNYSVSFYSLYGNKYFEFFF